MKDSQNMHFNASPEIFKRAKELRERMTDSEILLWEKLRSGRLNKLKFRRQHPVSKYIVDFYCHAYGLVIELDGEIHQEKDHIERDLGRQEDLESLRLSVIRFSNREVINELSNVLIKIIRSIEGFKINDFRNKY